MQIVNFFLSRPSVYTLPGTWEKQPLIKHGNYAGLPPEGQIIAIILILLFLVTAYGIYMAFGPPNKNLTDPWDEHDDLKNYKIYYYSFRGCDFF